MKGESDSRKRRGARGGGGGGRVPFGPGRGISFRIHAVRNGVDRSIAEEGGERSSRGGRGGSLVTLSFRGKFTGGSLACLA